MSELRAIIGKLLDATLYTTNKPQNTPVSTNLSKEEVIDLILNNTQINRKHSAVFAEYKEGVSLYSDIFKEYPFVYFEVINAEGWKEKVQLWRSLWSFECFKNFESLREYIEMQPKEEVQSALYMCGDICTYKVKGFDTIFSKPVYRIMYDNNTKEEKVRSWCDAVARLKDVIRKGFYDADIMSIYDEYHIPYAAYEMVVRKEEVEKGKYMDDVHIYFDL